MPNRLAHETSPYLLQHANNPVDWYPWGPEALAAAKASDRPILLSVGYSACHWCHVMERESFENAEIARQMNQGFVNIKVDREERPDLDEIYMAAVQAFTGGRGGWPMTVFLTPDGKPYFGGTYFPPEPRGGMPGFGQVLAHASRLWAEKRDQIDRVTGELVGYLQSSSRLPAAEGALTDAWLDAMLVASADEFDAQNGGFGGAPKFPPHGTLPALLAAHHRGGDPAALGMVTATLDAMAKGGMYDLLGGGFARYSVDAEWRVPHFEKMLYDNGQLVPVYVDAWKVTGNPHYARVVQETLGWVLREMQNPEGGFYASQDADSEGVEGRYYAWTPRELRSVLGFFDGTKVATLLGVTDAGTFEHGASVLRLDEPIERLDPADQALLQRALPALLAARRERVAPGTDTKVITAWNAQMASAFARAGAAMGEARWVEAAARNVDFLLTQVTVDGRLQRTWKDGRARLLGYLDDHALLLGALLDVYEASFEPRRLDQALALADRMIDLFWDDGGFYYTGRDAEALVTRSRHLLGGAEPSGNGVAALSLLRLAALTGREDLADKAETLLRAFQNILARAPRALGVEVLAGAWRSGRSAELGVVGDPADPRTAALLAEIRRRYLPFSVLARLSPGQAPGHLPWMARRDADAPTAYVCEGGACQLPTRDPAELSAQLQALTAPPPERSRGPLRDHAPNLPADPAFWLNTDTPLDLATLRGNVVVLDFWTYCCINCLHVLPELAAVERHYQGQPVAVIGVHSAKFTAEKERANVARALRRHGVRHPVVLDSDHNLWDQYVVKSWPTVVVLDTEGRVAWRQAGEVDREQLATVVEQLLAEGRKNGTLGEPAWSVPDAAADGATLRYPGKVCVWPDPQQQAMRRDPFASDGRLYIADTGHHRILEASLSRGADGWPVATVLRTFGSGTPGLRDGSASEAHFHDPQGMARLGEELWVADTGNHALRRVDLRTGAVSTVAGTGRLGRGRGGDPSKPRSLDLRSPWDVAVPFDDPNATETGAVFIAMAGTHQIWVYLPELDQIGPFLGSGAEDHVDGPPAEAALAQPSGLCLYGRFLFIADSEISSVRAFDLEDKVIGTVVGGGLFDFGDIDGEADRARLQHPLGVTVAGDTVYIADTFNNKVKALGLNDGEVRTLADGFGEPGGIAAAGEFLIVADTNHHRIMAVHRKTGETRVVGVG